MLARSLLKIRACMVLVDERRTRAPRLSRGSSSCRSDNLYEESRLLASDKPVWNGANRRKVLISILAPMSYD